MAELPAPSTLSPGKLKWIYTSGDQTHEVGSNLLADVDVTDVATIRTAAVAMSALLAGVIESRYSVVSWKITDPTGVTLYEEPFVVVEDGTITITGDQIYSDSSTVALTGKGQPDVGFKQGQTKFTVEVGFYIVAVWAEPTSPIAEVSGDWSDVRDELNGSEVHGADFYGSKANFRLPLQLQMNAHFQKKLGL